MKNVYVVGTCDTKNEELVFLRSVIQKNGLIARTLDVGTSDSPSSADISNEVVASYHPLGRKAVLGLSDRAEAIKNMSFALCEFINSNNDVSGVIGIGGSGGTALIAPMMQMLPLTVPKLLVSTVASGNVAPYVGATDISMMYSVVDFLGLNPILKTILTNAGNSISGMVSGYEKPQPDPESKTPIGLTMFGVTTVCVESITDSLREDFECLVFHATGTGGQSMEKLAESQLLEAVIDITTTEVCDYFMGGVFPCLESRFDIFGANEMPYIGSVGALDMVNFGSRETVPQKYKNRNLFVHNAQVTLMRTTSDENKKMGVWIAGKLNKMYGKVSFFLPMGGVSIIDSPGKPFYDPDANKALFDAIEQNLIQTKDRKLIKIDSNINDPIFSNRVVEEFRSILIA